MDTQAVGAQTLGFSKQRTMFKVVLFTLLVHIFAWSALLWGGSPTNPGLGLLVWGLAPIGSALVLRLLSKDWQDAGFRFKFKQNKNWYLLSVLLNPISIALIVGLGVLLGLSSLAAFSWSSYLPALFASSVIYLVFATFEELGWRGYLAPKMAELNLNKLIGHLIVGIIWASWHLPFISTFADYTGEGLAGFIPRYVVGIMALAIVYGEIRLRTESVWPAVLMHWVGNMIATPLMAFMSFKAGSAYLVSFGTSGLIMIVIMAALGIYLYWQREQKESSSLRPLTRPVKAFEV